MSDFGNRPFPRGALLGAAALVGLALVLVAGARVSGIGTLPLPASAPVETRVLRFEDGPNGAVAVYEAGTQRVVKVLAPGTNNFVRGVLRGLARERRLNAVGPRPPFQLTRWADGRLSLTDPATGRRIDLEAFGATNAGSFARLLTARGGT